MSAELTDALAAIIGSYAAERYIEDDDAYRELAERVAAAFEQRWLTSMCGDPDDVHQYLTTEPFESGSRRVYWLADGA